MKCYSSAKKKVAANETTWEELYEMELAVDPADHFASEFHKKKKEQADASGQ